MTKKRSGFSIYAIELSVGAAAGLAFLLVVLGVLQFAFPSATGLGELITARRPAPASDRQAAAGAETGAVVAVLSGVRRDVRDKPSSSVVWSAARRGMPLEDGHAVQSYEDSGATITFDEKNRIELGEKSVIVLRKAPRTADDDRQRTAVLFMSGMLRGRLGGGAAGGAAVEVVTGGGTVRPRDAGARNVEIALSTDRNASALAVLGGAAEIVWKDKTTVVPPGYMVTYDPSSPPGRPAPLPAPPALLTPQAGETFRYRGSPPVVTFSWKAADDTAEFTLELARDPKFTVPAYKGRQTRSTFSHGALGEGEYYWRVTGLRGALSGEPSAAGRFAIVRDQAPPRLSVEFPEGPVLAPTLVLRGSTAPGCRVVIGEVGVPTDDAGRFEHTLTLEDGYNFIVVQAVDSAGNTAFASHTVVARLAAAKGNP